MSALLEFHQPSRPSIPTPSGDQIDSGLPTIRPGRADNKLRYESWNRSMRFNVQLQSRAALPPETHGTPWPQAWPRAAASSVRLDLDDKWNGLPDVASGVPI